MLAGVPTIVSTETGTKELITEVDSEMVCNLASKDLAKRIITYLDKSASEKKKISEKSRSLAKKFNRAVQLANFKKQFDALL